MVSNWIYYDDYNRRVREQINSYTPDKEKIIDEHLTNF